MFATSNTHTHTHTPRWSRLPSAGVSDVELPKDADEKVFLAIMEGQDPAVLAAEYAPAFCRAGWPARARCVRWAR